jgi:hypothetical protein
VRISAITGAGNDEAASEFAPDHSLFNETIFRETVLLPAEQDSDLTVPTGNNTHRGDPWRVV